MKKLILLAFLAIPILTFSQEAETAVKKDDSKLALFSAKTGSLLLKSYDIVDKIGNAEIQSVVLTNLVTGDKSKGMRVEKSATSQYGRDAISFIDEDEIDGLLKSIEIIKEKVLPTSPSNYQEVTFRSKSGFEAGCFWSKGKWSPYMQVDRYNSDSIVWMKDGDIEKLESIVNNVKNNLQAL